MKKQIVVMYADGQLADSQVPKPGTMMDETDYDRLVRAEDYKLNPGEALMVYKPRLEQYFDLDDETSPDPEESLLLCLVHKAIPEPMCEEMIPILRTVARSDVAGGNRNIAAGTERVAQYKKDGSRSKVKATPKIYDPLLNAADRERLRGAKDGTAGFLAAGVRAGESLPCRKSYWSKENEEETQELIPLIKVVNETFRRYAEGPYDNQLGAALNSRQWLLGDPDFYSVFTTMTVNRSWQTAAHVDSGDFKDGLGVLCCFGEFAGSHLIFPRFRTAVQFGQGDILLGDVGHEVHGNSELLFADGSPATEFNKPERLSSILCYQEKMQKCSK